MSGRRGPILVLGSINIDMVARGPRLPAPGETVLGAEFYRVAGGKGANQAVAAARAARGGVTFIAAVGSDDFGRESLAQLARESIDTRWIQTIEGTTTGVALILVDRHGQNLISVASGANARLTVADMDRLPEAVFAESAVALASLEVPEEVVEVFLRRAHAAGCTTILNPAPATATILRSELLQLVDILTPNETELQQLASALGVVGGAIDAAADGLRVLGCRSIVVTCGSDGVVVVEGPRAAARIERVAARRVEAVDATGAGDAFNGALAVALAEGFALVDAVSWANVAAAWSVTRRGAQPSLATREEIDSGPPR